MLYNVISTQECQMYKQGHTGGIRRYLRAQFEAEADAIIKIVMLKIKGGVIIIM